MSKPKLYYFLDPSFGFEIVKYFFNNSLHRQVDLILIVSTKTFIPKRHPLSPKRILDTFSIQLTKGAISRKFKIFSYQIKYLSDVNRDSFIDKIPENSLGICTGFNQIFKQSIINKFSFFTNLHPSILPCYRGPTPILWCKHYNEEYSGWTIHKIDSQIDHGEIIHQEMIKISDKSRKEILELIASKAKHILYELILSAINSEKYPKTLLEAKYIYLNKISYMSFFNKNK